MKATPEMRQVRFSFRDRIVLIPIEITGTVKYALPAALILLLIAGFGPGGYSAQRVMTAGMINAVVLLVAFLAGATLPPALLPWLPGRAFSVKGAWVGLALGGLLVALDVYSPTLFPNWLVIAGWLFLIPVIASFLAMNFTGSSTYTSLSGVKKEMRVAVPLQLGFAVSGLGLWLAGIIVGKT
jgi:hypothetical protein